MAGVLVIGYGNTVRGDDGLGPAAAEELLEEFAEREVRVLSCHLLTPELAEPVSRAGFVVFIDASYEGEPGALLQQEVSPEGARASSFTHHFDPPDLLALAEAMYGRAPRAVAVSLTGETFETGRPLSDTVRDRLPDLLESVRELVMRELAAE